MAVKRNIFDAYSGKRNFSTYKDTNYLNSKVRINRDNLGSETSLKQFNTYRNWGAFNLAVDVDPLREEDFYMSTNAKTFSNLDDNNEDKKKYKQYFESVIPLLNVDENGVPIPSAVSDDDYIKNQIRYYNGSKSTDQVISRADYLKHTYGVEGVENTDYVISDAKDRNLSEFTKKEEDKNNVVKCIKVTKTGAVLKKPADREKVKSTGVRSIFNKLHAVPQENKDYGWRLTQNMPLIDSPTNRKMQRALNGCTVKELVDKSHKGLMGAATFEYSDFMFCKYLGKVPNNHLITLRRYAIPVTDYVKPYGNSNAIGNSNDKSGVNVPKITTDTQTGGIPMGTMVTWFGTPGNDMQEILKYNFSMPFKKVESKYIDDKKQSPTAIDNASQGSIGSIFGATIGSTVGKSIAQTIAGPAIFNQSPSRTISTPGPNYDSNKAFSGVDMIKSIMIRDELKGLQFQNDFSLTFDYELRSYDGINGKQAMLDLLGNVLTTCYTTGDFWPGSYRHSAGSQYVQPLSSLECMKKHKTFSGYVRAFQKDFQSMKAKLTSFFKDPLTAILTLLDNLGGVLLGGELQKASPIVNAAVDSLLSDAAVGFWHVTIGNPCAPIMSIGNLVMTDCEVQHYGPLGLDDFPTGLKVTCKFTHGKPRDRRLIERMYNGGADRVYMPLNDTVASILKNCSSFNQTQAETYGWTAKQANAYAAGLEAKKNTTSSPANGNTGDLKYLSDAVEWSVGTNGAAEDNFRAQTYADILSAEKESTTNNDAKLIKQIFGTSSGYSLVIAAGEVEQGAPTKISADEINNAIIGKNGALGTLDGVTEEVETRPTITTSPPATSEKDSKTKDHDKQQTS